MKESILKRKQEEVASLRRNQRKISNLGRNKEKFNPKTVKLKWTNIEKKITKVGFFAFGNLVLRCLLVYQYLQL
jgi:hypothetical protein